jgi:uncharacterized protein
MQPRFHVITPGVDDVQRALRFYREGLGLPSPGVVGTEFQPDETNPGGAVAMFELDGGLILAGYGRDDLAKDAGVSFAPGTGAFSIGHIVPSREAVDALLERAVEAGATLLQPGRDRPWGIYAGYFRDPDGHLWEIVWNPGLTTG